METMDLIIETPEELPEAARTILNWAGREKIFCFFGEMGAGKTTMIKEICKELGVKGPTSSPTFSIVNEYHTSNEEVIFHFDFYRIRNEQEALDLGIYEYLDSGAFCFIEWPEKIYNFLPDAFVKVKIDLTSDSARKIILTR